MIKVICVDLPGGKFLEWQGGAKRDGRFERGGANNYRRENA
jgi:hypothetical protein